MNSPRISANVLAVARGAVTPAAGAWSVNQGDRRGWYSCYKACRGNIEAASRPTNSLNEAILLKRVSYISTFSRPLTREEITQLAAKAEERNRAWGVTGMLMSSGGIFYQVLEGPVDAVDRLFQKIAADERHKDVLVLSLQEEAEHRQFPSWAMKKIDLDEEALARLEPIKSLLEAIVVQRESMQRLMRVLSRSVWQELMDDDRGDS